MHKVNPLLQWWVTPKLPPEDVFADHAKGKKGLLGFQVRFSQWVVHPIKRRFVRLYLKFLKMFTRITVIGITGSAGKSTMVQMLASVLRQSNKVCATPPSIDPVYNIPNTMAKCPVGTRYLILEMSVEYPNEMDYYLWLAKPDIGMILNIYPTHTQFFKDEAGVFKEKRKLVDALSKNDIAILNRDDKRLKSLVRTTRAKVVLFGKDNYEVKSGNEFTLKIGESKLDVQLPILGEQFIQNAIAAATCARQLGASLVEIKHGLESFTPPEHRMRIIKHISGAVILDDTYNNNPQAAKEALKTFGDFAADKKKIIVMGDMLELGTLEEKYHQQIGEIIGKMNVDFLIGVGLASKTMVEAASQKLGRTKTRWVSHQSKVMSHLSPLLAKNSAVLIKGSRSIHLENLVARLNR